MRVYEDESRKAITNPQMENISKFLLLTNGFQTMEKIEIYPIRLAGANGEHKDSVPKVLNEEPYFAIFDPESYDSNLDITYRICYVEKQKNGQTRYECCYATDIVTDPVFKNNVVGKIAFLSKTAQTGFINFIIVNILSAFF